MSSSLCSLVVEIIISYGKNYNEVFLHKKCINYNYVNDIVAYFKGNRNYSVIFYILNYVNFSVETASHGSIHFMYQILKNIDNRYRKNTFTDTIIPNLSLSPYSHKLAAYKCVINKAITVSPVEKDLIELNIFKIVAQNNNYKKYILIYCKKQRI